MVSQLRRLMVHYYFSYPDTSDVLWLMFAKVTIKQLIMERFDRCAERKRRGWVARMKPPPSNDQRDGDPVSCALPCPLHVSG